MDLIAIPMIPGLVDVPDSRCAAGQIVADDVLAAITGNAAFSVVRCERIYMGFYKHGDTVGVPISPADGYQYAREECTFETSFYSPRGPGAGFASGEAENPPIAPSQSGNLYWWISNIDDNTGIVSLAVSYYQEGGAETISADGIVKVYAVCQRQSVNVSN